MFTNFLKEIHVLHNLDVKNKITKIKIKFKDFLI